MVVFASAGRVERVVVDPPYAGTDRGACVHEKYSAVRIPAFSGSSVRVGKFFVFP